MDVEFPPKNYMEAVANQHGKYIPRLYLQERSGGVIGANMMIGHNVIFDIENQRVGFARSDCRVSGSDMYDKVSKPFRIHRHLREVERARGEESDEEEVTHNDPTDNEAIENEQRQLRSDFNVQKCPLVPLGPCNAFCGR